MPENQYALFLFKSKSNSKMGRVQNEGVGAKILGWFRRDEVRPIAFGFNYLQRKMMRERVLPGSEAYLSQQHAHSPAVSPIPPLLRRACRDEGMVIASRSFFLPCVEYS